MIIIEWLTLIRSSLEYIEKHLLDDISASDVAENVHISVFFLMRGFSVMTGYTISEYIKSRRLSDCASDVRASDESITDIALRYRYDTPESFSKAFSRFHGVSPSYMRKTGCRGEVFDKLSIKIIMSGGNDMNVEIVRMFTMKLIGFPKSFTTENSMKKIPEFWDEICEKYAMNVYRGNPPANAMEKAVMDNCIGEYAVCADSADGRSFEYIIAGKYSGGEVPEGMKMIEFPMGDWAVFNIVGALPDALQSMTERIFREWLPGNGEWELSGNMSVEWYDCVNGNKDDDDYHSAVWIPVRKKN